MCVNGNGAGYGLVIVNSIDYGFIMHQMPQCYPRTYAIFDNVEVSLPMIKGCRP